MLVEVASTVTEVTKSNHINDLIVILLFFGMVSAGIVGVTIFFIVRYRTQEPELRLLDQLNVQKEVEHLSENMVAQLRVLFRLPWRVAGHRKHTWYWNDMASWVMLLLFIASFITLVVALVLPDPSANAQDEDAVTTLDSEPTLSQMPYEKRILVLSTFGLIMSVNLFLVVRQHLYYRRRRKVFADDARYRAISETSFSSFNWNSWYNRVQILVLLFEFVQLMSFPLRDLLLSPQFRVQNSGQSDLITQVIRMIALLPQLSTMYFYVLYWSVVGAVLVSLGVALLFHLHNQYARRSWPIFWVSYMVPIAVGKPSSVYRCLYTTG